MQVNENVYRLILLRRENTVRIATSKPGGQIQQDHDDRDPDMIHHFRISARLEEERRANFSPNMGVA